MTAPAVPDRFRVPVLVLGSGIAGLAGCALSQLGNVGPDLGQGYIVDSFMVVVLGGVGSLWGTLVGVIFIALINNVMIFARLSPAVQDSMVTERPSSRSRTLYFWPSGLTRYTACLARTAPVKAP